MKKILLFVMLFALFGGFFLQAEDLSLTELAKEVYTRLEELALKGYHLGEELVTKEITYQIWLQKFVVRLGIIFIIVSVMYLILVNLVRRFIWTGYREFSDHGFWLLGVIIFIFVLIAGLIMVPCALVTLKHLEFNPIYYILQEML